jgi:hypothetical protein
MKTIEEYLKENSPRPEKSILERLKWGVAERLRRERFFTDTRCQMEEVYRAASEIDVSQLLAAAAGTRLEYQMILDGWRQIQAILDTPDIAKASSKRQDALVRRVAALRAQTTLLIYQTSL